LLVALFCLGLVLAGVRTAGARTTSCPAAGAGIVGGSILVAGGKATATFSISAACPATTVTLASYEAPAATFSLPQTLFDDASATFASGGPYTLTVDLPDCFFQVDLVTGTAIPVLTSGNLYGNRKAAFTQGGVKACPPPTTTSTTTATTTTGTTTTGTTTTGTTTTGTTTTGTTTTGTTTTGTTTTGTTTTGTTTTGATSTATTTTGTTTSPPTTSAPFVPPPLPPPPTLVDLSLTKRATPTELSVGQQVTYVLTVTNAGPAVARDVVLVDPVPDQLEFVSVSDSSCTGTTIVTCMFGSLDPGISRSVTVVAVAKTAGTATNLAVVSTSSPETDTSNNRDQATVVVRGPLTPPPLCRQLALTPHAVIAGHRASLVVSARFSNAKPAAGITVTVKGPGVSLSRVTDSSGHARFELRTQKPGVLQVHLAAKPPCPSRTSYVRVNAPFRPPTFTG
jgi:uncharacterized protein DUF11